MSYVETRIISLTSQSATQRFNGEFQSNVYFNFGSIYLSSNDIIHKQVQLLNAQIPYSFYVINYTNNLFRTNLLGSILTYTIPTGNYSANSLISALKTSLGNPTGLSITISSIDGKMTFTYTANFSIYNNFKYSIGNVLGFVNNNNYTSSSFILLSPNPLNLLGIKTLQVRSGNLIMNNVSSIQGGQTTLLTTVPVIAVPFGMIDYNDKSNNLMTIQNDSLDEIYLDIIDGESGEYINFNNQDWCITLAIHLTRSYEQIERTTFATLNKILPNKENPLVKNKDLEELNLLNT